MPGRDPRAQAGFRKIPLRQGSRGGSGRQMPGASSREHPVRIDALDQKEIQKPFGRDHSPAFRLIHILFAGPEPPRQLTPVAAAGGFAQALQRKRDRIAVQNQLRNRTTVITSGVNRRQPRRPGLRPGLPSTAGTSRAGKALHGRRSAGLFRIVSIRKRISARRDAPPLPGHINGFVILCRSDLRMGAARVSRPSVRLTPEWNNLSCKKRPCRLVYSHDNLAAG